MKLSYEEIRASVMSWEASEIKKFAIFLSDEAKRRTFFSDEASETSIDDEESDSESDALEESDSDDSDRDSDEDSDDSDSEWNANGSDDDDIPHTKEDCIGIARKKLDVVCYEQGIQDPDDERMEKWNLESWKTTIRIKSVPTDLKVSFCNYLSPD
eukprot:TRINITY_DN502_c1_g1_i6.p2 TRINITY_DN502_c1_g1~~TRINITY_DN502_c1_g1_i6.p2  ORF type:complete len:156 (+),score=52.73 TRINITY_DN502_c1_g1_i6:31-498(+)